MGDQSEMTAAAPPAKRGEAAWKADKERIAARNEAARKEAKAQRHASELEAADRRRAAERLEAEGLRRTWS